MAHNKNPDKLCQDACDGLRSVVDAFKRQEIIDNPVLRKQIVALGSMVNDALADTKGNPEARIMAKSGPKPDAPEIKIG